jgi:hypothetical protein
MQNTPENNFDSESEISLSDILEFIQESWRQILVASIVGAALGFGGWSFFGTYKAELILVNNTNTNTNTKIYGLDLITWRTLQKSLPNLAFHLQASEKPSAEAKAIYHKMSESTWWSRGVIPSIVNSKTDLKDMAGISKGLDSAISTILTLNVSAKGGSRDSAINNVLIAANFVKSGGAYLQLKSLLNGYEIEVIATSASIQNEITSIEIEQLYLKERLKSLDELYKRFPGNPGLNQQIVDLKDASAKYLPISIQMIAVNNDINQNKESLIRFNDRINQIALIKQFLVEALLLTEAEFDGILLSKELLGIESKLRNGLPATDIKNRQALDRLRSELLAIEARFTKGLEADTAPATEKTGMLKATAGGLAGAGFLMLVFLLGRKILSNLKKDS